MQPLKISIDRRRALSVMSAAAGTVALPEFVAADDPNSKRLTGMGLVIYDCNLRRRAMREQNPEFDLFQPLVFLKHCHRLGAGGMQASLGTMAPAEIEQLRAYAAEHELFIEAIVRPPADASDLARFTAEIITAREVGVQAARTTIMPGRRYERFKTLGECREFQQRGQRMLELAVPVLEKHRVPFAVENHKDQTLAERIALFEHLDCEFIGACVDTGNSFALLDGAYGPIEALAPYAFSVHLKDQSLQRYNDGFLLGDIPLGQGSFDLKRMVATIKKAKPAIRFSLELITRDPLKVPCLTDEFYATLPSASAIDLARTMRFVNEHRAKLQHVSTLSPQAQVALEDANVAASLLYAGKELGL